MAFLFLVHSSKQTFIVKHLQDLDRFINRSNIQENGFHIIPSSYNSECYVWTLLKQHDVNLTAVFWKNDKCIWEIGKIQQKLKDNLYISKITGFSIFHNALHHLTLTVMLFSVSLSYFETFCSLYDKRTSQFGYLQVID